MPTYNSLFDKLDISTRPKRRRAVTLIITLLSRIHQAEWDYMERIPQNLTASEAYAAAELSTDLVIEAINYLADAY